MSAFAWSTKYSQQVTVWNVIKRGMLLTRFYTPDFFVMLASGALEAHEVKGFWQDDARVKIKCAADIYPLRFFAVKKSKMGWLIEEV